MLVQGAPERVRERETLLKGFYGLSVGVTRSFKGFWGVIFRVLQVLQKRPARHL